MTATARKSKTFTISLPPDMAREAEAMARDESRSISELFREALRAYRRQAAVRALREAALYGATQNPYGYTEEDIPRIIQEVRTERRTEQEKSSERAG